MVFIVRWRSCNLGILYQSSGYTKSFLTVWNQLITECYKVNPYIDDPAKENETAYLNLHLTTSWGVNHGFKTLKMSHNSLLFGILCDSFEIYPSLFYHCMFSTLRLERAIKNATIHSSNCRNPIYILWHVPFVGVSKVGQRLLPFSSRDIFPSPTLDANHLWLTNSYTQPSFPLIFTW